MANRVRDGTKLNLLCVSYRHGFTNRFQGLDRLTDPKVGFAEDCENTA